MVRFARSKRTAAPRRRRRSRSSSMDGFQHGARILLESARLTPERLHGCVHARVPPRRHVTNPSTSAIQDQGVGEMRNRIVRGRSRSLLAYARGWRRRPRTSPAPATTTASSELRGSTSASSSTGSRSAPASSSSSIRVCAPAVPLVGLDIEKRGLCPAARDPHVHQFAAYESNGVVESACDANARQLPIPVTSEVPAKALDDE